MLLWLIIFLFIPFFGNGHELRPAYLEMQESTPGQFQVSWKVPARGPNRKLPLQLQFPTQCEISSVVRSHYTGDAWVEYFTVNCQKGISGGELFIDGLSATLTDVLVRVSTIDGSVNIYRVTASEPKLRMLSKQGKGRVITLYLKLGIEHILGGVDHLLFVLVLMLFIQDRWKLVGAITAFTVAHSITLAAATLGFMHIPAPPVEACIALSIVFVAREILRKEQGKISLSESYPWIVAFSFGLLHGFGFAGGLAETGLPQTDIPFAVLFFNVGVEIGQLLFVAAALVIIRLFSLRNKKPIEQFVTYSIGSVAAFWVIERVSAF